jgi:hypothetical protein
MHAILFLCYLNGIRKSILLREYEMDSMQRRAVVYAAFGVSDVFAAKPLYEKPEKKCKDDSYNEMDIHKRLIERYINWDQNVTFSLNTVIILNYNQIFRSTCEMDAKENSVFWSNVDCQNRHIHTQSQYQSVDIMYLCHRR